jgi:hypothetical protein
MKQKSGPDKAPAERVLKNLRRQTRHGFGEGLQLAAIRQHDRLFKTPGPGHNETPTRGKKPQKERLSRRANQWLCIVGSVRHKEPDKCRANRKPLRKSWKSQNSLENSGNTTANSSARFFTRDRSARCAVGHSIRSA